MKFKLEIECNNAAFDDDPCVELGRILNDAGERIAAGEFPVATLRDGVGVSDINGNRVGRAWIEESE